MAGIPTSNIFKPGAVAVSMVNRQLISDLQILQRHYYKEFVQKYGDQNYTWFLSTYAGMEEVKGKAFYHYESLGKLMLAVTNKTAVSSPAAGATVTVAIAAEDHYSSGTLSPLRVGETVRVASSGIEGKILTINTATPNAHTCTIRPLKSTQSFVSAGSTDLLANDVIQLLSNTEAGEASTNINPQTPVDEKITNYCTEIRDDWYASDLAEMEEIEYNYPALGGTSAGINQNGQSAYTYRGLSEANLRYLNNIDFKLMKGDLQTNTGLNSGATGTVGLIPAIRSRGQVSTYTAGSFDIAKMHEISRLNDVNGVATQIQWLTDTFQKAEFDDTLFQQYPAGSFVYGTGSASEEASVAYGFQNFRIDNYLYQLKVYKPFNTEFVYGKTPDVDEFRNFGIMIPQGKVMSKFANGDGNVRMGNIQNLTVMYEEPRGGGTVANGIKVWETGGAAPTPTNATMAHGVHMITYRGLRSRSLNQFQIVQGS